MSTERPEPASPACLANEADDAYMGFATKDELAAFLNELLEAERAGTGVALRSAGTAAGSKFAELLRDVHHDEARWCAMLLRQLKALGVPASTKIGAFEGKALAIEGLPERIAFVCAGAICVHAGPDQPSQKLMSLLFLSSSYGSGPLEGCRS